MSVMLKIPEEMKDQLATELGLEIQPEGEKIRLVSPEKKVVVILKPGELKPGEKWYFFIFNMADFPDIAIKLKELGYVKGAFGDKL